MRILLGLLLVASPCFAGLIVSAGLTRGAEKGTLKQYFQNSSARIDFKFPGSDGSFIIHNTSGAIMWIDHSRKSYLEINKSDLDRVGSIISAFNKQPTPAAGDIKLTKQTGSHTVGKWNCTRYEVANKGKKAGTFCVVPMESVGASAADYQALQSLVDSVSKTGLVPAKERGMLELVEKALHLGFVVQSNEPEGGVMQVENIIKQAVKQDTFASPKGYARTDITSLLQKQMMQSSGK
jgi:hypothetical protein